MEHKPPVRLGLTVGLSLVLALAMLDVGLTVLALTAPITPLTVLRVLLIVLDLLVMAAVMVGLFSLNGARYALDRNALIIHWGPVQRVIPLAQVEGVLQGMDLGRVARFRGLHWPGYWSGVGRLEGVGQVCFYCAAPPERQLVIKTASQAFAISPENVDRFMNLYAAQRAMGPSREVEPSLIQPAVDDRGLLRDRAAWVTLGLAALSSGALWVFLTANWHRLPALMPLHFLLDGAADRLGSPAGLVTLVGLGTLAWLVDGALGAVLYRSLGERVLAYVVWGAAVLLQILLWGAVIGLL